MKAKKSEARGALCVDRDENGRALYEEDILAELAEELSRRKEERRPLELQWILNANFLSGHQYCDINPQNGEVVDFEPGEGTRGCFNRIFPLVETRLANLKQLKYRMTVRPRTSEADDAVKADISTKLLAGLMEQQNFSAKRDMLVSWSELCGSAFVLSWWDRGAGRETGRAAGGEPVREGALCCGLLTPYEVYPESVYKQDMEDQRSVLLEQVLTADELYELYGVRVPGGEVDAFALTPVSSGGGFGAPVSSAYAMTYRRQKNSVRLYTFFERASRRRPEGRLIIATEERLLFYGPLPYDSIPICVLKCRDMPGQFFGRSVIADLIPLQRAYNGAKNKIHDHIRTLAANPLLVPEGSVEDVDALEGCGVTPGTVLEYNAERGVPTPLQFPEISDEVRLECESIAREMEYVAGVSQLMVVGGTPSGVVSGTAIERLRQIDATRLSLTGDNVRECVRKLARIWLQICKRCASGCRILDCVGANDAGGVLVWTAEDINSFDIAYDTENELKYGEEAQKEAFLEALRLGLFCDETGGVPLAFRRRALEMMRLGGYGELMSESELQLQNARRENAFLALGRTEDPGPYDDDALHLDEHRRFALQQSFAALRKKEPELAARFDEHIAKHAKRLAEAHAPAPTSETERKNG